MSDPLSQATRDLTHDKPSNKDGGLSGKVSDRMKGPVNETGTSHPLGMGACKGIMVAY